ncbi:MAG: tetratricopeptide repeat protein [Gammaproteobacteria bacterium]|nr:tetratricopeptide repeat protein [Gammaproteobacteria bacterium]
MKLFRAARRTSTTLASLAILALSTSSVAQTDGAASVLQRYGNLDIERIGPTIDAELGQKYLRRGNTYSNLERFEEAIDEYRRAISADPNLTEAIRNLANTYYYLERFDEAKPLLARFIRMQTTTTASLIAAVTTLGELERSDGNYAASISLDLRAIELNSNNDSQVHIMANTYNNAGEADKAIAVYQKAVEVMPGNAFFDRSLGRILEQENRIEDALRAYESAAAKNPDSDFYTQLVESTRSRL